MLGIKGGISLVLVLNLNPNQIWLLFFFFLQYVRANIQDILLQV